MCRRSKNVSPWLLQASVSKGCQHTVCDNCLYERLFTIFVANTTQFAPEDEKLLKPGAFCDSRKCPHSGCTSSWDAFLTTDLHVPPMHQVADEHAWTNLMYLIVPSFILHGVCRSPDPDRPEVKGWQMFDWSAPPSIRLFAIVYEALDDLLYRQGGAKSLYTASPFSWLKRKATYLRRTKRVKLN